MRPTISQQRLDAKLPRRTITGAVIGVFIVALMTGCADSYTRGTSLSQRIAEMGCLQECRSTKESCDADARYDYRQCQAGYVKSFRDYRWCLASAASSDECGYPWWSCSENLYGYCANRYNDCKRACAAGAY